MIQLYEAVLHVLSETNKVIQDTKLCMFVTLKSEATIQPATEHPILYWTVHYRRHVPPRAPESWNVYQSNLSILSFCSSQSETVLSFS